MWKCDITISKKNHINVGDFSSVEPNVSITLKDVDLDDLPKKKEQLSELVNYMWMEQFMLAYKNELPMVNVNQRIRDFADTVDNSMDFESAEVQNEMTDLMKKLNTGD